MLLMFSSSWISLVIAAICSLERWSASSLTWPSNQLQARFCASAKTLLVLTEQITDLQQQLTGHIFLGKVLQQIVGKLVLAGIAPQFNLPNHVGSDQLVQPSAFLVQIFQTGKIADHPIQFDQRIAIALRLNVQLDDPQSLVRIRLIDVPQQDLGQDVARNRGGVDAHIPVIGVLDQQAFDFRVQRCDLGDPLHHVDATIWPAHAENAIPELVKGCHLNDRPHAANAP